MEAKNSRTCGGGSSGRVQTDDVGEDNPHPRRVMKIYHYEAPMKT